MNINLENIPVIIDEEKIKKLYNGDYKKALEDVLKNERKLAIKNVALEQNNKKQKEIIDKIKEYINTNKKILYQGRNEFTCEIQYSDEVVKAKDILELLEEIE